MVFPPYHMGQKWETWSPEGFTVDGMLDYTYQDEWHAVYTIQLGQLVETGVFDWKRPELDWSAAAFDADQYARVCAYFVERFRYREISIIPPLAWMQALKRMLVYELMPKYSPLYETVADGFSPLASENEYYKHRKISSLYPETLLSGNSDYISDGNDEEFERVKVGNVGDALQNYKSQFESVDKALLDELEVLFISMYTSYVNGL